MRELLSAAGHEAPAAIPSLELNPEHALVRRLDGESDPARFERLALLLFEQAVLSEGRQLEDPAAFVVRLNELLADLGARGGGSWQPPARTPKPAHIEIAGRSVFEAALDASARRPSPRP
jgi:hypothetical protein